MLLRFFLLLIFSLSKFSFGQPTIIPGKPGRQLTKKEEQMDKVNRNCVHRNKYSLQQRNSFYPFNKAYQVKLVSFKNTSRKLVGGELPMKNGKVDYSKLNEQITLSKEQINSLSDLLYNTGYRGAFFTISENRCIFNPRNAILFSDEKGKTFAYLEICFECSDFNKSSSKIKTGDFCEGKYILLKQFFLKAGIKYGVQNSGE